MGPPDLSLRTLVTRQTDQITILTSQLEASLACSANLRTRLSNTLDTLDTLQAELDAERRKNDKHLWMNLIQELQREKEEMQEVVESLIRRVERSKGKYERWPSAKMYLPTPAGRSIGFIDFTPVPVTPPRMEALLHALAFERRRYKQASEALQNAHETVLSLEAQVARREAELESQDHQRIVDARPIPQERSMVEALHPDLPEIPLSEVVHSLSIAEEHNHALEQEVRELNNRRLKDKHSPRSISVAVQTLPPPETEAVDSTQRSSPMASTRMKVTEGLTNATADIQVLVGQLSNAINGFQAESKSMRDSLRSRKKPTDTSSIPPSTGPASALNESRVAPISHTPPQHQLPPEPPFSQPPPNKTPPDFQHILRVEHECIRLTHINERLERELSELRAIRSPVSRTSSISFVRSPALRSAALPTVSPSGFSVRSSGERDMDISSTPLRYSSTLPDEDCDPNRLSDFEFFLGHTRPPAPENSSMNAEPSRGNSTHPNSQDGGNSPSMGRPSSAPPDIDNTHPSTLLSPIQLSTSLPPRSKSVEPRTGDRKRALEIQRELGVANESLATKSRDLNELRELVNRLKDQVI